MTHFEPSGQPGDPAALAAPYDAIIIGGSYAGLAAALQLARARRRILVIDAGLRRNRFAATSHGFLGQDGRPPGEIVADARAQLLRYPSVTWLSGNAMRADSTGSGFMLQAESGGQDSAHRAARLVLATGVIDHLPAIPGLAERWGKSVFHCPYCHGYELDNGNVGVLAANPLSMHHALLLPDWGSTTLLTNGQFAPDAAQRAQLHARGVTIEHALVRGIVGARADVLLDDGRTIALAGLFTLTRTSMASPLAEQLGCAFEDSALGAFVRTDALKQTSVPGVFACGDAARIGGSVALAVGDGTLAGVAAHRSMIFPAV